MPKSKSRNKKKAPKRVLALPDLELAKTAVLNSLTSASGQRTYDHAVHEFVTWYCSEPRLAFNRTVVLRYRIHLEQRGYAPATINLRLAAVRRRCSGMSSAPPRRARTSTRSRPTTCVVPALGSVTLPAATWIKSSSYSATSPSRQRNAIWAANRSSESPLTIV